MGFRPTIDPLANRHVHWLGESPNAPAATSTRIRLARNLEGFPFPQRAAAPDRARVVDMVREALSELPAFRDGYALEVQTLNRVDRSVLLERRLASREMLESHDSAMVFVSADERVAIMVNEEDHLRIQVLRPGLELDAAWRDICEIETRLDGLLPFAFHEKLGYLTACPTNLGTGMRASVMLHLPSLVIGETAQQAINGAHRMGLTVRGLYGEGSDSVGNLFQVSNQSTLGDTEKDIIDHLGKAVRALVSCEKNARQIMLERKPDLLADYVSRAYGALRHAYLLGTKEAMQRLSALRLGVDLGMIQSLTVSAVNELWLGVQSGHLQKKAMRKLRGPERAANRADMVRERLGGRPRSRL
jgi:protein arginine kinase